MSLGQNRIRSPRILNSIKYRFEQDKCWITPFAVFVRLAAARPTRPLERIKGLAIDAALPRGEHNHTKPGPA